MTQGTGKYKITDSIQASFQGLCFSLLPFSVWPCSTASKMAANSPMLMHFQYFLSLEKLIN